MKIKSLDVLAVGDPAVEVYDDPKFGFLEEFQKTNNIEVNFDIVSFNKYYAQLMESFQKYKYDVVMVAGHLWLKEFVEKGYLSELKLNAGQDYNYLDIVAEIREELELNGRKYLLPSFSDGHILVYRKSDKTKKILVKKYCNKTVVNFGNEEVKNAIQKKESELAVTWSGQLGTVMDKDCLEKDSLDFAYLEKPWKTTWSFALNNLSQKKEAAEEFMYYITSQKVDRAVGEHCGNPTRLSNFEVDGDKFCWYKVVLEMLTNSKSLPDSKNAGSLISICSAKFHQALKGNISVEEALNNIEKLI